MMMMQASQNDMTKQRMFQAKALAKEARGGECSVDALVLFQPVTGRWHMQSTYAYIIFGSKLIHKLADVLPKQLPKCVITAGAVRCNEVKHQSVLAHRPGTRGSVLRPNPRSATVLLKFSKHSSRDHPSRTVCFQLCPPARL